MINGVYKSHTEQYEDTDKFIHSNEYPEQFQTDVVDLLSVIAGSLAKIADILEGQKNDNCKTVHRHLR